jgi:hypothetical protein
VTPAEWAGVFGAILAVGAVAERIYARLSAPPARETYLPPPAPPPALPSGSYGAGAGVDVELRALRERVDVLEARERETTLQVIGELRELQTIVRERTRSRGGNQGG